MSRPGIAAALAAAIFLGGATLARHWDAIEKENNAFAKDCNDRGGVVIFGMQARQCLGAAPAASTTKHDKEMESRT